MKLMFRGVIGVAVLVSGLLILVPHHSSAAEGFNVITSPLPIKISTSPGKTITNELRIKNQGTQAEGIKVGLMKFAATGTSGQPDLFDLTAKDTYASWVHFSPAQFTAQPNVWVSVTMTINVPPEADLGYYLAVTFSPANQPGVPNATDLKGAAATLVLLDVKTPNEKRAVELVSFTTDHKLYEYLPTNFNIKLHNTGNIYIAPQGNIFIQRGSKTITTLDFNAAGGSVLPQSNRVFAVPWKDGFPLFVDRVVNGKPLPDKHGVPKRSLTWNFTQLSKFRIGKYTAKLLVVYDNGKQDVPREATVSFWVIPWKIILMLLIVLTIVGFGLFSFGRSVFRKTKSGIGKRRKHEKIK